MVASNIINSGVSKKINLFCLVISFLIVLILPLKKEIWYDETVSILCSKGISHETPGQFANTKVINSTAIEQLNTAQNVFSATVNDNANSFLYNITLHWFTMLFGNSITVYMLFSRLCGIAALIAFYGLCNLFFKNTPFTSIAVLLLATDNNFVGMSHEIRAYAMGIMFVNLAAVYFFKYMLQDEKPAYLFLTSLFSVCAILSHFLSVYIILVLLVVLLFTKRSSLFSLKNIIAILLPVCLLGIFFYFAYSGLQIMGVQNHRIQERAVGRGFSVWEVLLRSLKFTAINFRLVFPAFTEAKPVLFFSFFLLVALYIFGARAAGDNVKKRNLHLLFALGASGSLFLAFLSIRSQHYTALYYRYFSFCLPFCSLFIAYLMYVCFSNHKVALAAKGGLCAIILLPVCALFISGIKTKPVVKYNHIAVSEEIIRDKIVKIEVPQWQDAFLIQSVLPDGYKIDYVLNGTSTYFTCYKGSSGEKVPVIRDNE